MFPENKRRRPQEFQDRDNKNFGRRNQHESAQYADQSCDFFCQSDSFFYTDETFKCGKEKSEREETGEKDRKIKELIGVDEELFITYIYLYFLPSRFLYGALLYRTFKTIN